MKCDACNGTGVILNTLDPDGSVIDCPVCNGNGNVPDDNKANESWLEEEDEQEKN